MAAANNNNVSTAIRRVAVPVIYSLCLTASLMPPLKPPRTITALYHTEGFKGDPQVDPRDAERRQSPEQLMSAFAVSDGDSFNHDALNFNRPLI